MVAQRMNVEKGKLMRVGKDESVVALRDEIRSVRDAIIDILARIDDIQLQQLPQIRAEYALKLGCWEQALLEAELAGRRARRRLALAQAQANRGEKPQMDAIESQLDAELAEWTTNAEQARLAYEHALAYLTGSRAMSKAEAGELKRVYRVLVKRLHPDARGGGNEQHAALFLLAQSAYKTGDVDALRSLEVATRHLEPEGDDLDDADDLALLEQELELARIEEGVMRERLRELEDGEEMRLGRLLADPEWLAARTTELRLAVEGWERVKRDCDERLRELREGFDER